MFGLDTDTETSDANLSDANSNWKNWNKFYIFID
jgi:hypothetical protein